MFAENMETAVSVDEMERGQPAEGKVTGEKVERKETGGDALLPLVTVS